MNYEIKVMVFIEVVTIQRNQGEGKVSQLLN